MEGLSSPPFAARSDSQGSSVGSHMCIRGRFEGTRSAGADQRRRSFLGGDKASRARQQDHWSRWDYGKSI